MAFIQYLFIFSLALGAACSSDRKNENEHKANRDSLENTQRQADTVTGSARQAKIKTDTLYRISGTEPFWNLIVARPQLIFTSMEGDTLLFDYQEPQRAAGRPQEYVQAYNLGDGQQLLLRQMTNCPCSDGMSNREYPYQATLILNNRVLEGCGRTP